MNSTGARFRRFAGLLPFILLSPVIAVRLFFSALAEFPRLLMVICVGLAAFMVVPDFVPASGQEAAWEPDSAGYRLSDNLDRVRVTARTRRFKRLKLGFDGVNHRHRALPGWNWTGPMLADVRVPKAQVHWKWTPASAPKKAFETCLWGHPINEGRLFFHFRDVPLGGKVTGFVHFLRSAAKDSHVTITIKHGKKVVKKLRPKASPGSVMEFSSKVPGTGNGKLSFIIESKNRVKNHICFDAVIEGPGQ